LIIFRGLEGRFFFYQKNRLTTAHRAKTMKTKVQKSEELTKAKTLLAGSQSLIFADFTKVSAEDIRKLRTELKKNGANFLVIKKRLLAIALKERGIDVDLKQFKVSIGTIFAEGGTDTIAGPAYKFFSGLEVPEGAAKDVWIKKLLAGYEIKTSMMLEGAQVIKIGTLPPREVLLAQLLGVLAGPIRSFMYLLDEKAKRSS
jgi:large subunit ribosomal protein L10